MFRPMQRIKQQMSAEDCLKILKEEKRGVLSVLGDEGYPYGIPLNHYYNEEDGKLYFHSGKTGHKIDAMKKYEKASFIVFDSGTKKEDSWALRFHSVIVFGKIEFIEDRDMIYDIARRLSYKFTDDEAHIDREIERSGLGTLLFALVPEQISGKNVTEE
ncbi:MAG: pyridoxamine 5'-phosphate oxidase family protein [Solobacterium sp.]|nr:pyridoxamine 5'-phosphate oxidase family protein [Solobacterium sp.]